MIRSNTYTLDKETIKLNAYRLLCLFYANKEIARLSDPDNQNDAAFQLERLFFAREMTQVLLNIAIGVRVLDDQMTCLAATDPARQAYLRTRDEVNLRHHCMMFNPMPLREVCNKVIHATKVEPHATRGSQFHKIDEYNRASWSEAVEQAPGAAWAEPVPIDWEHLSGNIRLSGIKEKKRWEYLLEVPTLVEAVFDLLEPQG